MRAFFKNGHNYRKDDGLEAITLSADIIQWWDEINSTSNTTNVYFGGPTGISTIVILMSWWCKLLKGQPDANLSDCLRTLEEVDRAILAAVQDVRNRSSTSPPDSSSSRMPIASPPQTCGAKQLISDEPPSRKQLRRERVYTGGEGAYTQWVHCGYIVGSGTVHSPQTQWVSGGFFWKVPTDVIWINPVGSFWVHLKSTHQCDLVKFRGFALGLFKRCPPKYPVGTFQMYSPSSFTKYPANAQRIHLEWTPWFLS